MRAACKQMPISIALVEPSCAQLQTALEGAASHSAHYTRHVSAALHARGWVEHMRHRLLWQPRSRAVFELRFKAQCDTAKGGIACRRTLTPS